MRKFQLAVFFLVNMSVAQAQDDSVMIRRISDEILLHGESYDNLRALTKNIGQRLTGSPNFYKAIQWGLKTMKASGATKAWLQECQVPHWVRGGKDAATATVGTQKKQLDVIALGNSVGTGAAGVSAAVVEIKSFEDLEQKRDSVKGKIVFYNYRFKANFVNTFQSYVDAVPYRAAGPSLAAKYGAKAVIVRSMTHSTDNNPHTGSLRYDTTQPEIPAVAIGLKDADWLDSVIAKKPVSVSMKTGAHFLPDTVGDNVIGELTGSEFPDQFITIGGHLDSWDPAEGANDDGSGVVQTMEVLRTFVALGYHPKHSIRFVLFANEENGLRGGLQYAAEAKAKNEKHIFALESDAGSFTPRGFTVDVSDAQLQKLNGWLPLLQPYGASVFSNGGGGADVEPLKGSVGAAVGELLPDSQRYFDYHHARNDVFENVNKRELELGAINMTALIYLVDKYGL